MDENTSPGGIARAPYKTIRELFPDDAATADTCMDWATRPVLLVRHGGLYPDHWNPEHADENRWRQRRPGSSSVTFFTELAKRGWGKDDVTVVQVADDGRFNAYRWPRNLPWKALPVVGDARFVPEFWEAKKLEDCGAIESRNGFGSMHSSDSDNTPILSRLTTGVALCILDAEECDRNRLAAMTEALGLNGTGVAVATFDGRTFHQIPEIEIAEARAAWAAHHRFVHSHVVNSVILCSRALYKLAWDDNDTKSSIDRNFPRLAEVMMSHWEFGDPLVLQMLFALRRRGVGRAGDGALHGVRMKARGATRDSSATADAAGTIRANPFLEADGDKFWFVWRGTGAYPEWRSGPYAETPKAGDLPLWSTPSSKTLRTVEYLDLVDRDADGNMVLTDKGRRFLDIIGPEADDPDMPLRWRKGEMFGGPDDVKAMDRWLNRVFRSIKRRVANLPASPFTEPGIPWQSEETNIRAIYGWRIALDKADLADPEVSAAIHNIQSATSGVPWRDRTIGVDEWIKRIRGPAPDLVAWCGVPLGVYNGGEFYQSPPWRRCDLSDVEKQAREAFSQLPAVLANRAGDIGFQRACLAPDPRERFIDFRPLLATQPTASVIVGKVLRLETLNGETQEFRDAITDVLVNQRIRTEMGVTKEQDVVIIGGDEPPWTIWVGMPYGAVGQVDGTQMVSKAKVEDVEVAARRRIDALPAALRGHPGFSDCGLWLVRPDGSFAPVAVLGA